MKQFKTISSVGAFAALVVSAFLSTGCAGTPVAPDYSDHSSELTVKFKFLDSKGVAIPSGSATISGDLTCGGEITDLNDALSSTDLGSMVTFAAGRYFKTLSFAGAPAPFDTFDPGTCSDIDCSADITGADGTVYTAVPGVCTIGKSVKSSDGKHTVGNVTGTFTLPPPATSAAPTPGTGDTGMSTLNRIFNTRRNSAGPASIWNKSNSKPYEGFDRGGSGKGGSSSALPERNT